MQRSVRRRNLNGDHRCTSACTPCACTRARVCVRQARLRRMDGSEELNAVVKLVTRAHLLQNLLGRRYYSSIRTLSDYSYP